MGSLHDSNDVKVGISTARLNYHDNRHYFYYYYYILVSAEIMAILI
jgi:hypothetical protein